MLEAGHQAIEDGDDVVISLVICTLAEEEAAHVPSFKRGLGLEEIVLDEQHAVADVVGKLRRSLSKHVWIALGQKWFVRTTYMF